MRPLLGRRKANPQIAFLLLLAGALLLSSCDKTPKQVQVSEQPEEISQLQDVKTEPREGRFSLRSRIAYSDIKTLIESEIPATYQVQDSRRLCKRIIGIKACGTANWNLNVNRQGDLKVSGNNQHIVVQATLFRSEGQYVDTADNVGCGTQHALPAVSHNRQCLPCDTADNVHSATQQTMSAV